MRDRQYQLAIEEYEKALAKTPELSEIIENNIAFAKKKIESDKSKSPDPDVFIGIAAIPERVLALEKTIESLLPQTRKIGVYLNNWDYIPDFLTNNKILISGFNEPDIGDIGKFHWVDDHDGIYFSCDDDLIYPADYVKRTVEKLRQYAFKAAVGWHGSLLLEPFNSYYEKNSRRVFMFSAHRPRDTPVHILGTGCCAFHTRHFLIKKNDFKNPNMADIFFSIKGQEQKIPFLVIEHNKGEIVEHEGTKESSIYSHSHTLTDSKKNTQLLQNEYVRSYLPWVLNNHKPLSILIIGRFENFSKGGIYKSCHLIKNHLLAAGHFVEICDTQKDLSVYKLNSIDLCWIYPGDPERPDFSTVDEKIQQLREKSIPTIVNLSYLYEEKRTAWIAKKIKSLNEGIGSPVFGAVFTESAANDPILSSVKDFICVVPKTILPTPSSAIPTFKEREGICLGDATKLGNSKIIGGSINPWIEAIHRQLPHVNLYAYKQYQGENPHPKIKYVPHMKDDFGDWLSYRKIFICANVHLTFEMVACEAQSYGTPVIYRHMPHSLSEYISATGIAVRSPDEMAEIVAWLYNNETAWNKISKSSVLNGESNNVNLLDASLEGYLYLALHRARKMMGKY
jgi:glycosyltransferase involved in cell wall biosynthesis